jgi:hypothetical protein
MSTVAPASTPVPPSPTPTKTRCRPRPHPRGRDCRQRQSPPRRVRSSPWARASRPAPSRPSRRGWASSQGETTRAARSSLLR